MSSLSGRLRFSSASSTSWPFTLSVFESRCRLDLPPPFLLLVGERNRHSKRLTRSFPSRLLSELGTGTPSSSSSPSSLSCDVPTSILLPLLLSLAEKLLSDLI